MYKPTQRWRPPATTTEGQVEKLKTLVIRRTPISLTPRQKAFFEQRIQEIFLGRSTPDHSPYQIMIQDAIKQLNEEGGSSMVTISKLIRENHKNLPWHHDVLVKHHLRKLCECGDLIENKKCYSIAKSSSSCSLSFRVKREEKGPMENGSGIKLHLKELVGLGRGRGRGRGRGTGRGRGRGRGKHWSRGKGKGRGRCQGRGRSLGWDLNNESSEEEKVEVGVSQVEDKARAHHMEATEKQHLILLEEEADEKGLKENARRVKLHCKFKEVGALGQGKGKGRSQSRAMGKDWGRGGSLGQDLDNDSPKEEELEVCVGQVEDKVSVDHLEATEKYVMVEEEAHQIGVKENARRIKLHRKCKKIKSRDQGRDTGWSWGMCKNWGRGRSLGWVLDKERLEEEEVEVCVDQVEATERQYLMVEDEADETVQSKEQYQVQGSEDSLNVRGQAAQRAMISDIEPLEQEYRVNEENSISQQKIELVRADNSSRRSTTHQPHRKAFISNEEQEPNEIDLRSPHCGKRRGRSCRIDMRKEEPEKKMEQLMKSAEIGALRVENQLENEEQSHPKEDSMAVSLGKYLNDDNTWLIEEGDEPQPWLAGNREFVETDGEDVLDESVSKKVPKLPTYGIFPDWCTVDTTQLQELLTDDIHLIPEWSANDTPFLPDLSADDKPVVPDLSTDDILLISEGIIVDFIPKENVGKVEPPEGYMMEPPFKEQI